MSWLSQPPLLAQSNNSVELFFSNFITQPNTKVKPTQPLWFGLNNSNIWISRLSFF